MKRIGFLVAALTIALLALAPAAAMSKGGNAKCHAGVHTLKGGIQEQVFCGKASAKASFPGHHNVKFKGGSCVRTKSWLAINLGAEYFTSTSQKKPNYFGLTIGRTPVTQGAKPAGKDGTFSGGYMTIEYGNKLYYAPPGSVTVTLKGGRTRGSFHGTSSSDPISKSIGGTLSGTFSCG